MTKEKIEKRLQEIEKAMQQSMANHNMLEGGRQECLYWLDIISRLETGVSEKEAG